MGCVSGELRLDEEPRERDWKPVEEEGREGLDEEPGGDNWDWMVKEAGDKQLEWDGGIGIG